jgi:hypothetical protein
VAEFKNRFYKHVKTEHETKNLPEESVKDAYLTRLQADFTGIPITEKDRSIPMPASFYDNYPSTLSQQIKRLRDETDPEPKQTQQMRTIS